MLDPVVFDCASEDEGDSLGGCGRLVLNRIDYRTPFQTETFPTLKSGVAWKSRLAGNREGVKRRETEDDSYGEGASRNAGRTGGDGCNRCAEKPCQRWPGCQARREVCYGNARRGTGGHGQQRIGFGERKPRV
jgi:hypothetical protein